MEAAKKLQSYFISLQREDRPSTEEMLRKVHCIAFGTTLLRKVLLDFEMISKLELCD